MQTIKRFFQPFIDTPRLSLGSFLIITFRAFSVVVWPYLIGQLIIWLEMKNHEQFMDYLVLYAILWAAIRIVNFFINRVWRRYHHDHMRAKLYKQEMLNYAMLSNNETELIWTGKANSIIQKWCDKWIDMLHDSFSTFLLSLFIVWIIFVRVYIDLWTTWFLAFSWIRIFSFTISIIWNKYLKHERAERKRYVTRADRRIVRYIMSKFEMLLTNKVFKEVAIVEDIFHQLKVFGKRIAIKQIVAIDIIYLTTIVIMTYWLRYAGNAIIAWTMFFGEFTLRWMLFGRMRGNVEQTIFWLSKRFDDRTHVEKLWEFHDNPHKMVGYLEGDTFKYKKGDINITSIAYSYDASDWQEDSIFTDFSLTITWGQKTALVGMSGAGKSTLVKLIAGYLRPDSGAVLVDGQDLTTVSLQSYYQHIGYLTQEPSVFDGTIIDNLTYAVDGEIDKKRLEHIISLAKCDFIFDFKDGLETEIGERGVRLSWGQRQRLAIAKVFLKDPSIIILDEPTSALDSFSEEAITEAMHNLFAWRTVIIIAHRLQTVKHADDIIVLDQWAVIERGTHDELVGSGGSYAKMLELQSGF